MLPYIFGCAVILSLSFVTFLMNPWARTRAQPVPRLRNAKAKKVKKKKKKKSTVRTGEYWSSLLRSTTSMHVTVHIPTNHRRLRGDQGRNRSRDHVTPSPPHSFLACDSSRPDRLFVRCGVRSLRRTKLQNDFIFCLLWAAVGPLRSDL